MGGKVTLVGAGPGDPGLLTLKGREALAGAEAGVRKSLLPPERKAQLKSWYQTL